MDNNNDDNLGASGSSVFGDGELPTGASVFGDADDIDFERASVFAGVDAEEEGLPKEAIESTGSSVFGDVAPDPAPIDNSPIVRDRFGTGNSEEIALDLSDGVVASSDSLDSEPLHSVDEVDIDDGTGDPIDLASDPITEIPAEPAIEPAHAASDHSDEFTTGEAIALDVEPGDEDGLDAWSDLGASDAVEPAHAAHAAPEITTDSVDTAVIDSTDMIGADEDAVDQSWAPAHAAHADDGEPDVVRIGADSERFFEFDAEAPENAPIAIDGEGSGGSEMRSRVMTGVGLLAVAVIALSLGPLFALALIVIVVAVSAGEFYNALRIAGYQPATLLGLTASVAMPIAVYIRGTQAVALVLALAVVFGLVWYIAGVASDMPVMNLGVTLLGVVYIGVLGSFGAAMLETADRVALGGGDIENGTGLLLAAVILTMGYDVGAFFAGKTMGRNKLTAISPNKTVEGLIGGAAMTIVVSVVFLGLLNLLEPFTTFGSIANALIIGVAAAIMAPLGDLGESLIKRDLGIKDMGNILPGHGGFLDRFDALLFVLPTVYFLSLAFFYG